ncbi:MAG: SagB/ThcOx family dehydrogenase [Endomicrobiia bacterium]
MTIIKLPAPDFKGPASVEEALKNRRSVRKFKSYKISLKEISQLLWAAYGVTEETNKFKTTPSAGATYPLEIYYFTSEGIFYYLPYEHSVKNLSQRDLRKELAEAALNQQFITEAAIDIIICAVYERTTLYYGERGYRYVYMEAGHCAQNISLQAISLGLDSVCVGAFYDEKVKKILDLKGDIYPIYIIAVGKKM